MQVVKLKHGGQLEKYSLRQLERMPTISVGQTCNLKVEAPHIRIWLSRCGIADGEPYPNKVTVESLVDGCWVEEAVYQALDRRD